jgi:hypothetical protein
MQKMGARSLADLVRIADRLQTNGESALDPVAENAYDGLPRTSRTGKRVKRKPKGGGNLAK